jgi:hypothetical protein
MFDEHEPAEFELTPDLAAIERRLARMTPCAPRIDRDRLMFEAGKASSRPDRTGYMGEPSRLAAKFWPAATVLATAASVFLATMLVWQRQAAEIVVQPAPSPRTTPQMDAPAGQSSFAVSAQSERVPLSRTAWSVKPGFGYLGVRNVALARGVNAIDMLSASAKFGASEPADKTVPAQRRMLDELLPAS